MKILPSVSPSSPLLGKSWLQGGSPRLGPGGSSKASGDLFLPLQTLSLIRKMIFSFFFFPTPGKTQSNG